MKFTAKENRIAKRNNILDKLYAQEVHRLIRERYTDSEEFSILRKMNREPEEFAEYDAFVEKCKVLARATVYGEVNS